MCICIDTHPCTDPFARLYIHMSRTKAVGRGSLVKVDLLVLNVLLSIFPNLCIKIRVSLSHFTNGKTEAQSGQEPYWDQASFCPWAAFAVLGVPFRPLGFHCVASGKSLPSLGCSTRKGALRPLSLVFQPTGGDPSL